MWKPPNLGEIGPKAMELYDYSLEGYNQPTTGTYRNAAKPLVCGATSIILLLSQAGLAKKPKSYDAERQHLAAISSSRAVNNPSDPKPEMQGYLKYKFLDYPEKIGKNEVDKYWREGKPLEWLGALFKQIAAGANDLVELPFEAAGGLADNIGYNLFGGKARGEENQYWVRNAVKFGFNRVWGGEGDDEFTERALRLKLKEALDGSYGIEDTKLGGHVGTAITIGSGYLAFDACQKAFFDGESIIGKIFKEGTFFGKLFGNRDGDGAAAVIPHKHDPAPGM